MVDICQDFVSSRNLSFGTNVNPAKSKTKCLVFSRKRVELHNLKCIKLNGNDLPWVESVKHLGHTLQSDKSMQIDMILERLFDSKSNFEATVFNLACHLGWLLYDNTKVCLLVEYVSFAIALQE